MDDKELKNLNLDDSQSEMIVPDVPELAADEQDSDALTATPESGPALSIVLKARGRAFTAAMMSIAGTRQRSGRLWLTLLATFIVIALLIVQVFYRHRELNLGYALSASIAEREALHEENRKLRIELRVLSSRERLEPIALRQLGMRPPRPEQIFFAPKTDAKAGHVSDPHRRLDGLDRVKLIVEE